MIKCLITFSHSNEHTDCGHLSSAHSLDFDVVDFKAAMKKECLKR